MNDADLVAVPCARGRQSIDFAEPRPRIYLFALIWGSPLTFGASAFRLPMWAS